MFVGHQQPAAFFAAVLDQAIQVHAQQLQILDLARHQYRRLHRCGHRADHHIVAITPGPTIEPAPPLPLAQLADDAVRANIVGHDAAISHRPLDPGPDIFFDPVFVFFRASVQIGRRHQHHHTEIDRHIPIHHDPIKTRLDLPHRLGIFRPILGQRKTRPQRRVPVFDIVMDLTRPHIEQRALAAAARRAHNTMLRIVVRHARILVEIPTSKALRPPDRLAIARIGHAQMVKIDIVFGVVEPVVVVDEFIGYATVVVRELTGDRVPFFQRFSARILAAAQRVIVRPVEKGLVEIVGPDPIAGILLHPDQRPAGSGVLFEKNRRRLVNGVDQPPL